MMLKMIRVIKLNKEPWSDCPYFFIIYSYIYNFKFNYYTFVITVRYFLYFSIVHNV